MNRTGNQLFAGSGLTLDENRRIRGSHSGNLFQYLAQRLGGTHDFFEHGRAHDLFAQRDGFVTHTIFGTFTIIDVRRGRIPSNDLSVFGKYRWFVIRYNPLLDENGKVIRWYATGTDIDDRKRAEDRMRNESVALREEIVRDL